MLSDFVIFANDPPGWYNAILPIGLVVILIFFWRSMKRQESERAELQNKLSKNDEVLTHAGIYGTVVSVHDTKNEIVVKVDDNVRIKMVREAIVRNFTKEQAAQQQNEVITKN